MPSIKFTDKEKEILSKYECGACSISLDLAVEECGTQVGWQCSKNTRKARALNCLAEEDDCKVKIEHRQIEMIAPPTLEAIIRHPKSDDAISHGDIFIFKK